jgi:Rps23 Pro-64 3,4-dihydroxylase Tpa1-like proline 4-hydroxylase
MLPSWTRRLPVLRTYEALRAAQARLAVTKEELRRTREERDRARRRGAHVLSHRRLKDIVRDHAAGYASADPFPHVVIDELFDRALLDDILEEFDAMDRERWHHTERNTERKYSTEDFGHFGPATRALITQLNAGPFMAFLEQLTGIAGLIPDPHLRGGGLHEIRRDGALGVHADFNFYRRLGLYRRLNLLVYLNKGWDDAWGGELELWDRGGTRCVRRIAPVFNRAVIFDTSNFSYHGHPRPLACPPDRARKSIALYYYTVECPDENDRAPHTTVFLQTDQATGDAGSHVEDAHAMAAARDELR